MENQTSYCYKANTEESYNSLAAYIVTLSLNASFFPKSLTIVVTPDEDENDFKEVGRFIDMKGLNLLISPIALEGYDQHELLENEITPSCILQAYIYKMMAVNAKNEEVANSLQTRINACEAELSKVRQDKERYNQWWTEETDKREKLEDTLIALRTILNAIVE